MKTAKVTYFLSFLLLNLLALCVNSTPHPSHGLVELTGLRDELGDEVYAWMISEDEQQRLSALLDANFYDVGVAGTYLNAPPQTCSHCGKETEFIDWVYTALKRGVHSPEFIVESLKQGNTPKGVHHDVYCSRCGHLTAFRNLAGHEGGALHIAHAAPYDRASKTFLKRDVQPQVPAAEVKREASHDKKEEKALSWCLRCAPGNWIIKRDNEASVAATERDILEKKEEKALSWCVRCAPGNWIIKREDPIAETPEASTEGLEKKEEKALSWCVRCAPGNWIIKRDEPQPLLMRETALEKKEENALSWCVRCAPGNWIIKRESVLAYTPMYCVDSAAIQEDKRDEKALSWCVRCAPGNWIIKREDEVAEVVGEDLEKKEDKALSWCVRCAPGNWIIKREDEIIEGRADASALNEKEDKALSWCVRCAPGNWIIKREVEIAV